MPSEARTMALIKSAVAGSLVSILFGSGNVFYVDSGSATKSDSPQAGRSKDFPFATLDYAIGRCTASNGDVIFVMPGHTETVTAAAALAIDVAGISIIGLGSGSLRPTVNFTTAVGASAVVSAANCTIQNVLFTGGIDALTGPLGIQAADCKLLDIETRDVTGQATDFIVTTAAADRLLIDGWVHAGAAAAGADTAISIVGGDRVTIRNFWIDGNFAVSAIENVTTATTNYVIGGGDRHNYIRTRNSADIAITMVATATGAVLGDIAIRLTDNAANITEAIALGQGNVYGTVQIANVDGEAGLQTNITASADT